LRRCLMKYRWSFLCKWVGTLSSRHSLDALPTIIVNLRPVSQGPGEIRGFLERAEYMLSIAESQLTATSLEDTDKPGFRRYIMRVPLGVVLVIAPWKSVSSINVQLLCSCSSYIASLILSL
jgi:acyl-CoA reductase-like NAD-dependent aldehyde dehydrogenase